MKNRWIGSVLLSAVAISTFVIAYPLDEKTDREAQLEGMKKWLASISPSRHHEKLGQFVGDWDVVFKVYMGGPGSPPMETRGTSEINWVLGKRFIMEKYKGTMILPDLATGGMRKSPMDGIGFRGYDNYRNMYTGLWMSNGATNVISHTGSVDPSGKVFRSYGEMDEPMLNVTGRTVKTEMKVIDKDRHTVKIIDLHAGDEYLVLELAYTRKKSG